LIAIFGPCYGIDVIAAWPSMTIDRQVNNAGRLAAFRYVGLQRHRAAVPAAAKRMLHYFIGH
jgi:hypothetical protein